MKYDDPLTKEELERIHLGVLSAQNIRSDLVRTKAINKLARVSERLRREADRLCYPHASTEEYREIKILREAEKCVERLRDDLVWEGREKQDSWL